MNRKTQANPIAEIFFVFKPACLISGIFIEITLGIFSVILDGGVHRPIRTLGGNMMFAIAGLFLFFCSFMPLISARIRKIVCNPELDFEQAQIALIFLSALGAVFGFGGLVTVLQIYSRQ